MEGSKVSVDYDIHGIVGIRLLDAGLSDVKALEGRLRLMRRPLTREPDIVVRYVDELQTPNLSYVVHGKAAFTRSHFYFLKQGLREAKMRFEFDALGGGTCEILSERGIGEIPMLMDVVNLTALSRGLVSIHASAVSHRGVGVLMPGGAHSGKTTGMLAFVEQGASYVGDEWILLSPDEKWMYGLPQTINLHQWQVDQSPAMRRVVPVTKRVAAASLRFLDRALQSQVTRKSGAMRSVRAVLQPAVRALDRRLDVPADPLALAGGKPGFSASVDAVFLMFRHQASDIRVEGVDSHELASRIAAATAYERTALMATYLAYRTAFPERKNYWLDRAWELESNLLMKVLANRDSYVVFHPSPCSLQELYAAMVSNLPAGTSAEKVNQASSDRLLSEVRSR